MSLAQKLSVLSIPILLSGACSATPLELPTPTLPGPTPLPAQSAAGYRGDLRNTGLYSLDFAPLEGELAWQFETGGEVHASPVYADGVLYFASYDNTLYAVEAQTGAQLWQASVPGRTDSSPTVTEDSLYIGTLNGLAVFDRDSGALRFETPGLGHVRSSPVVLNGRVYFGSDSRQFYALDAHSGRQLWAFNADGPISSSPALWEERVFFGDESGVLYGLDAATGAENWRFLTEAPIFSSPAISAAGYLYLGGFDGAFYALQAFNGDLFWRWVAEGPEEEPVETEEPIATETPTPGITETFVPEVGTPITSSAAIAEVENMVYFGVLDHLIYALDKDRGELMWYFETGEEIHASPVYAGGVVYTGSNDNTLYALDAASGELLWSYETDGIIAGSPTMSDGMIYFASHDGNVYAVK